MDPIISSKHNPNEYIPIKIEDNQEVDKNGILYQSAWLRFLSSKKLENPTMREREIIDKFLPEFKAEFHKYM